VRQRSRWVNVALYVCLLLTLLSAAGLAGGHFFSLEIGVGAPRLGMLVLGMWRDTLYLGAIGEDAWWWFELKRANRQPLGTGALGFRWDYDPIDGEYLVGIPLWLTTLVMLWLSWALWKRRRSRTVGLCSNCQYDLRATPDRCPECGAAMAGTGVGGHGIS